MDTLIRESFIQIEEGCNYRQAFEQYLNDQGKYITNVMEIGYTRLIIDAVAAGLGVSLLPPVYVGGGAGTGGDCGISGGRIQYIHADAGDLQRKPLAGAAAAGLSAYGAGDPDIKWSPLCFGGECDKIAEAKMPPCAKRRAGKKRN